ncbi:hypothetical protein AN643_00335 [Candidatus Epulonipiscioides saccharophilum]|nr:hypothetical protein AN643_00335 [Epulopiscium sp. SCG-B10WGA-EpuloB]
MYNLEKFRLLTPFLELLFGLSAPVCCGPPWGLVAPPCFLGWPGASCLPCVVLFPWGLVVPLCPCGGAPCPCVLGFGVFAPAVVGVLGGPWPLGPLLAF